jgi:hypothetical protein
MLSRELIESTGRALAAGKKRIVSFNIGEFRRTLYQATEKQLCPQAAACLDNKIRHCLRPKPKLKSDEGS